MPDMDLTTYAGLKTGIASFLNREDMADGIPAFISLAEVQVRRRFAAAATAGQPVPRRLLIRADATLASGDEFVAVPSRFIGPRTFVLQETPLIELGYLTPEGFAEAKKTRQYLTGADPEFYTVVGDEFQLLPIPAQDYEAEVAFLQAPDPLSDANTSNWLLQDHPDIYLYGALTQAAPYLDDDQRISVWGALFTQAIKDAGMANPMPKSAAKRVISDLPRGLNGRSFY